MAHFLSTKTDRPNQLHGFTIAQKHTQISDTSEEQIFFSPAKLQTRVSKWGFDLVLNDTFLICKHKLYVTCPDKTSAIPFLIFAIFFSANLVKQ
jgi:hypothetical protein